MAKPTAYEKAWKRFSELYDTPVVKRVGGSRKQRGNYQRRRQTEALAMEALLALAAHEGIEVKTLNERDLAQQRVSVNGTTFTAGGLYFSARRLIKIPANPSLGVVIHELGHALDHSLGWSQSRSVRECVAIGVQYLLSVSLLGYGKARPNLRYAGMQGVSSQHVLDQRERIEFIHDYIMAFVEPYIAENKMQAA